MNGEDYLRTLGKRKYLACKLPRGIFEENEIQNTSSPFDLTNSLRLSAFLIYPFYTPSTPPC